MLECKCIFESSENSGGMKMKFIDVCRKIDENLRVSNQYALELSFKFKISERTL